MNRSKNVCYSIYKEKDFYPDGLTGIFMVPSFRAESGMDKYRDSVKIQQMEVEIVMKKRRGLLQRMMAVMFAAVLTVGMVSNTVSASVLTQEGSVAENVSGNDVELTEEETEFVPQADNIVSGDDWTLDADGKLTIGSDDGMEDWLKNRGLYRQQVTAIVLQEGVTNIGNWAFGSCDNLTQVTIQYNVTSIGDSAFNRCVNLESVEILSNVEMIGKSAFQDCERLQSVKMPDSVISIGGYAFLRCSSLTEITIPKNVSSIDYGAFSDCTQLSSVTMQSKTPPVLYETYSDVFDNCPCVAEGILGILVPAGTAEAYKASYSWMKYETHIREEHSHDYGEWQHDDTQHWKVCSCGEEIGRGNHDLGNWITDREATATEAGTKHRECQTCGYRQTETIPATGTEPGIGTVTPEIKLGANAPKTNISTPSEELKDMLLTDEEKQQMWNGTNVKIVLEVQDAGNTVSVLDRAAVRQALNGFTEGLYLNIDLYKLAGADRTNIHETAKKIRIVITVPEALRNGDSNRTRTFAVIRLHDGRAELLTDLDGSADTITIETDHFSVYAIVYKDTANDGSGGGNNGNDDNNGGGNDNGGSDNNGGGNDNGGSDNNGSGNDNGGSGNNGNGNNSGNNYSGQNNSNLNDTKPESSKDNEPKTGDAAPIKIYVTLAMMAGFIWLLLYFTDRERGMTEET